MSVPVQGKRAQRRAQRREDVLDAAMHIIVNEGLGALTIQRLAKATGASVGGLYRYYDSKEAVLAALQLRAIDAFGERQGEELERASVFLERHSPPIEPEVVALCAPLIAITSYMRFQTRDPERHRLIDAFLSASDVMIPIAAAKQVDAALRPLVGSIARALDGAAVRGGLRPGDGVQRTYVLWAVMHGLDHLRKRDRVLPVEHRVDALLEQSLLALFVGWGARQDRFSAAYELVQRFVAHDLEALASEEALEVAEPTEIAAS